MELQMLFLVGLWETPLDFHVFELCAFKFSHFGALLSYIRASSSELGSHSFEPHVFEPRSHVPESCSHVFEPHVYERHSSGSTLSEPRPHVFGPHPVGSLHFFDPDPTPPDRRSRNTRPVPVMSMRRISKWASRRTYKDNVSGMKLHCRATEIRAK